MALGVPRTQDLSLKDGVASLVVTGAAMAVMAVVRTTRVVMRSFMLN